MKYIKVYERLTEEERKTKEYRKKYLNKFIIFEVLNNWKLSGNILHGFCYRISQGWITVRGVGSIPIINVNVYSAHKTDEESLKELEMYRDMKNYNL